MKGVREEFRVAAKPTKRKALRHKTTRDCPRVTLRLSRDDHERLKELAGSMALSTYIRAKALGLDLPRRRPRSSASVVDKQAIAQILGLLGQSRIANNLNQLGPVTELCRSFNRVLCANGERQWERNIQ